MTTPMPPANAGPASANLGAIGDAQDQAAIQGLIAQAMAQNATGKAARMVPWVGAAYPRGVDIGARKVTPYYMNPEATPSGFTGAEAGGANYQNPEARPDSEAGGWSFDEGSTLRDERDVYLDLQRMTESELAQLAKQMVQAGLLDEDFKREDIEKVWDVLITKAADYHEANPNSLMTPVDMLELYGAAGAAALGSTGTAQAAKIEEIISRSRDLSSNTEARALLTRAATDALGRRPTAKEIDDLQVALNSAQTKNPVTTTTRTSLSASGEVRSQDQTRTGGVNADAFTDTWVRGGDKPSLDSEYGAYQAASTYYTALMQAIAGPGGR